MAQRIPKRRGEKFVGTTAAGGKVTLAYYGDSIGGGASNLTQAEFDAYQRARMIADPRNDGDWEAARNILEIAGFTVYIA